MSECHTCGCERTVEKLHKEIAELREKLAVQQSIIDAAIRERYKGEADKRMKLTALQKDVMYVRQFGAPYAHQSLDEMDSDIRLRGMK